MKLRGKQFNGGILIVYDNEEEAITKAKELKKDNDSANVVLSNGEYFVECPSNDFIRAWENEIYN